MGSLASSQAFLKIEKTNLVPGTEIEIETLQHGESHPSLLVYAPPYHWGQDS
jgi:hypothetical protein